MMILIYTASLKQISCPVFKEMDKIKIKGFHQPPSTILFDDPIPKLHPLISPHMQLKRFAQFIGGKTPVLKKKS